MAAGEKQERAWLEERTSLESIIADFKCRELELQEERESLEFEKSAAGCRGCLKRRHTWIWRPRDSI